MNVTVLHVYQTQK